jgi:hypothetical protein
MVRAVQILFNRGEVKMKLAQSITELTGKSIDELNESLNEYLKQQGYPDGVVSLSANIIEIEGDEEGEDK